MATVALPQAEAQSVEQKKNRIQVSNTKKPLFFYVNLAKVSSTFFNFYLLDETEIRLHFLVSCFFFFHVVDDFAFMNFVKRLLNLVLVKKNRKIVC